MVVDSLIDILLVICDKKTPALAPRALVLFSKYLINTENLPGNKIIKERFKYSAERIQKLSIAIYLSKDYSTEQKRGHMRYFMPHNDTNSFKIAKCIESGP